MYMYDRKLFIRKRTSEHEPSDMDKPLLLGYLTQEMILDKHSETFQSGWGGRSTSWSE